MVLVTGATGLVGTHLLVQLVEEKLPVRALYRSDRKKEYSRKIFLYYLPNQEAAFEAIEWVQTDINNVPELSEAFVGITKVYHCAAKISFNPSHFKKLRKVNIDGTANIINLSLAYGVNKVCHVSSIAALGENTSGSSADETSEWNPEALNSVYAITKYGAEMEVWRGVQEGLDAVIVNPGIIIGPGFYDGGSGFLFKRIHAGMKYYTSGTSGYVGVNDVITCMYRLMEEDHKNERYVLVGEHLSYQEAFSKIALALQKPAPTKLATPFLLNFAYQLQRISHFLFRTKRSIFKSSIRSALSTSYYKNDKIKKTLDYKFEPVQKAIEEAATLFLKGY
ncbi:NAD-dependent epimerase/dehydratase family protein [Aquimarina spongiae]|uniref:Nucleoside-diphosphate-sugar epimerase n=1 Tax=Aquimarina spongiae TaxID=570521 RepID=A0A1M6IC70_9FLAO|nr:NAD-dependent epimerase/dehydratase family protein [Aquimarina spongiae]SHJ32025.1 Nucleoside-diphosphate-sugar epimerase [Aquimarina spongiae]